MKERPLGQQGFEYGRNGVGMGYVILPNGLSREKYVSTCYKTGTISVVTEGGFEIVHRVRIGKLAIQMIDFPNKVGQLGSCVAWVNIANQNEMVVFDVMFKENEISDNIESSFIIKKSKGDSHALLSMLGDGSISLQTSSETGVPILNIKSIGEGLGEINITSDASVNIISPNIIQNKGDQSVVRGEDMNDVLSELIDLIATSTTPSGPLSNAGKIIQIKTKLKGFLSTKSKLE